MIDLSSRLTELLAERALPLRKRDRTKRAIDHEIVLVTARLMADGLQDRRDMAETLRPHVAGNIRVVA